MNPEYREYMQSMKRRKSVDPRRQMANDAARAIPLRKTELKRPAFHVRRETHSPMKARSYKPAYGDESYNRYGNLLKATPADDLWLFDIQDQAKFEQQWYVNWVKDKLKLYRAIFKKYSQMPRAGIKGQVT